MTCTGRVKFFLPDKGWGRLELTGPPPEDLPESEAANGVFVHLKDVPAVDEKTLASLEEGQEVTFSVSKDEKGWRATEVRGPDGEPVKTRLHRTMLAGIFRGVVAHWNSERAFGWIATDLSPQSLGMQRVPKAALGLNGGRVYFRWRDCGPSQEGQEPYVQRGKAVVFQLYWDEKGLGALYVCDAITLRPLSTQGGGGADYYKKLLDIQALPGGEQLTELGKDMQKCALALVVSRAQAGCIIGQKGETVKGLKEKSGADRIYAENGPSDHRLVEIKGSPEAVARAVLLIAEHLAKESGQDGAPPTPLEARIAVPDEGFGRVVGKGKAQIAAIEERCPGATVQIAQRVSVGSLPVQAIAVGGESEAMAEATRMVIVRVSSCCGGAAAPLLGGPGLAPFGPGAGGPMGAMTMLQNSMGGGKDGKGKGGYKGGKGGGGPPGAFGGPHGGGGKDGKGGGGPPGTFGGPHGGGGKDGKGGGRGGGGFEGGKRGAKGGSQRYEGGRGKGGGKGPGHQALPPAALPCPCGPGPVGMQGMGPMGCPQGFVGTMPGLSSLGMGMGPGGPVMGGMPPMTGMGLGLGAPGWTGPGGGLLLR